MEEKTSETQTPSATEYTIISEQNLFHPERQIPVEKKVEQPLPKPDFVLFGTLIADNTSLAYLEDLKAPRNTSGRGKRQVALRKGDSMSGFTLKEIETDKVVMVRGEEKMIVPINDPSHPKMRETQTTPARTSQSPPIPAHVPGSTPAAAQQRPPATKAAAPNVQPVTPPAAPPRSAATGQSAPSGSARENFLNLFRPGQGK